MYAKRITKNKNSVPERINAATANPRSRALKNALIEATNAIGVPTTTTPGPSAERGWPQQNISASTMPLRGTTPNMNATRPDIPKSRVVS